MLVIPAIDLIKGKVVRLIQGDYDQVAVYSKDPAEIAKEWQAKGAGRLHIVDLDGARSGAPMNTEALGHIIESIDMPVEVGGGLRNKEDIRRILDLGASWVILGTKACEDLDFIKGIVSDFGEKIIISIDAKEGKVATRGWVETTDIEDVDLIKRMQDTGIRSFIYTDIARDGMLSGLNIKGVSRVLKETNTSLIYSGGVSSVDDVKDLRALEKDGLAGVIIGKALYEKKIDLTLAKAAAED
ncbi:MAG: 1-(5-phosphoribosyl)-5-[(5-phosphoribosylamino)methylideneamino]imidazole-4-carboxamide isomerase [Candidatus Omnitrophica bacterium]|nr:1-(5-phosphoribosyl)-5-[(5-phosphoribosylamino)methylideneamino]imidazole-4-carboxamide isomerase [Candidatus Omnitrophota bacterium]